MNWELCSEGNTYYLVFPRSVYRNDLHGVRGIDPWDDFDATLSRDDLVAIRDRINLLLQSGQA